MEPEKKDDQIMTGLLWGGLATLLVTNPLLGTAAIAGKLGWTWWKKGAPARAARRTHRQKLRLAAATRQRYAATLHFLASANLETVELEAARQRAKQQYLRDLDEQMHDRQNQHPPSGSDAQR